MKHVILLFLFGGAAVAQRKSDKKINGHQKIPGSLPSSGNLLILLFSNEHEYMEVGTYFELHYLKPNTQKYNSKYSN
jgi:hypothetical protein